MKDFSVSKRGRLLRTRVLRCSDLIAGSLKVVGFVIGMVIAMPSMAAEPLIARITTSLGVITAELNERAAPTTVANFINLAQRALRWLDVSSLGEKFHGSGRRPL